MIPETTKRKERMGRDAARRPPTPAYWLIAKSESRGMEIFTIERAGEKALPVFSFREEAEMFLDLGAIGVGWRVHGSCAGEVVSILCGPCAAIAEVVLDPLPEMLSERTVGLVALAREPFMETIMRRGGHPRRRGSKRDPHREANRSTGTDDASVPYPDGGAGGIPPTKTGFDTLHAPL